MLAVNYSTIRENLVTYVKNNNINVVRQNFPELTLEMEIPALLFNFGILGFILYFIPFLIIDIYSIYYLFKYYRKITVEYLTYMSSAYLAIAFSFLAGYTFFNVSSKFNTLETVPIETFAFAAISFIVAKVIPPIISFIYIN